MSHNPSRQADAGLLGWVGHTWKRIPAQLRWPIEDSFQPEAVEDRLLPGEEPQLIIGLAWYRDILGIVMFDYFRLTLGIMLVATAVISVLSFLYVFNLYYALIPLAIYIYAFIIAVREFIEFRQWRLVRTNARLILSTPQHSSWPWVDNIDLKNLPAVIDTNWSKNPVWRLFQLITGARDVAISLSGYSFVDGTARVSNPLIFPDMMPEDIFELRRLVFPIQK